MTEDQGQEYEIKLQPKELSKEERKVVANWLNKIQMTLIAANQNDRLVADPLGNVVNDLIVAFSNAKKKYDERVDTF